MKIKELLTLNKQNKNTKQESYNLKKRIAKKYALTSKDILNFDVPPLKIKGGKKW